MRKIDLKVWINGLQLINFEKTNAHGYCPLQLICIKFFETSWSFYRKRVKRAKTDSTFSSSKTEFYLCLDLTTILHKAEELTQTTQFFSYYIWQ